jgi:hypothetical protein
MHVNVSGSGFSDSKFLALSKPIPFREIQGFYKGFGTELPKLLIMYIKPRS